MWTCCMTQLLASVLFLVTMEVLLHAVHVAILSARRHPPPSSIHRCWILLVRKLPPLASRRLTRPPERPSHSLDSMWPIQPHTIPHPFSIRNPGSCTRGVLDRSKSDCLCFRDRCVLACRAAQPSAECVEKANHTYRLEIIQNLAPGWAKLEVVSGSTGSLGDRIRPTHRVHIGK